MFVLSFSSGKIKIAACFAAVCILCLGVASFVFYKCSKNELPPKSQSNISVNNTAENTEGILKFISNFGYSVNNEPDEIKEVIIPFEFNDVYLNYNEIQKSQGYDLTEYSGKRVKRWTFTVKDYPQYENTEYIKINILIFDGKVIGGDVCSVKSDGFMHGFERENN